MMNRNIIEGNWKQLKGKVKQNWGKLTDDQLDIIAGKRDELAGKIQEAYGCSQDDAEKQISNWEKTQKDLNSH
jgi:uncharacterized protein YjbJ (UPF0337 family)